MTFEMNIPFAINYQNLRFNKERVMRIFLFNNVIIVTSCISEQKFRIIIITWPMNLVLLQLGQVVKNFNPYHKLINQYNLNGRQVGDVQSSKSNRCSKRICTHCFLCHLIQTHLAISQKGIFLIILVNFTKYNQRILNFKQSNLLIQLLLLIDSILNMQTDIFKFGSNIITH